MSGDRTRCGVHEATWRPRIHSVITLLACLGAVLLRSGVAPSAEAAPNPAPEPEGVVFNAPTGTYTVQRAPKRSLDEVMKSIASWQHQVLADDSTADYVAEDGILAMECSACGLTRPSAIDIASIDLKTLMAYEAGTWHIGVRSTDGTQDFFGVLRGELGSGPHDPALVDNNKRIALIALTDLYDLAYLTQNPTAAANPAPAAKAGKAIPSRAHPPAPAAAAPKSSAPALTTLAINGDIEGIEAQQRAKRNSREVASALEAAYGARARTQMLAGEVDAALQTLNEGRQKFGKSPALRDREAHYVVIGDAYDRLRLGVKLDVAGLQRYLEQIRTLEPDDATAVEQMLARTLSHRIADQRAAGRSTIADDLLGSGRELFPASAEQLTRGTAGALEP
jgi:hypothetical protein